MNDFISARAACDRIPKKTMPCSTRSHAEKFAASVTLRQLRYFIAVAETGKITAAAAMIGISPSGVTEAVSQLEALCGIPLFGRSSRGLELTFEGHRLLAHARAILSAIENAGAAVAIHSQDDACGRVRLAATVTVMGYYIAPVLARFKRCFPNVVVEVMEAKRPTIEAGLMGGEFDLAIMLISNLSERKHFSSHTLNSSMRRLWLPAGHKLFQKELVTLEDVSRYPYIQLLIDDAEASTADYWHKHDLRPNISVRTDSVEGIRSLIANGQGVTILSDMMYRPWSLEGDRIEVRELAAAIPNMTTGVVWTRTHDLSIAARAFLDFCRTDNEIMRTQSHRTMPTAMS